MPTPNCYAGPAFSVTGDDYFTTAAVEIHIILDDPAESGQVLAAEWYLDDLLIAGNHELEFTGTLSCGAHAIGARLLSAEGWSGIKSHAFRNCRAIVSTTLTGPDVVDEGSSNAFQVKATYSGGNTSDVTAQYSFSSSEGSFAGAVLTIPNNTVIGDTRQATVVATKSGSLTLSKNVTINDKTVLSGVAISGPATIREGDAKIYNVIASYTNGLTADISAQYTFSSTEGTFTDDSLFIPANSVIGDNRQATITASKTGSSPLTKLIDIKDASKTIGVLVADFFNFNPLDIIAYIENPEVAEKHLAAYAGNNIVPGPSTSDALIMASDYVPQTVLNWRFEFNIVKLMNDYPNTQIFTFRVKARGNVEGQITGNYIRKKYPSTMIMTQQDGYKLPSAIGDNYEGTTSFSGTVRTDTTGSPGSHQENDLYDLGHFEYNVDDSTMAWIPWIF